VDHLDDVLDSVASMRVKTSTLVALLAMVPLLLSVLLGLKSYAVWPQIGYLWSVGANPITELVQTSPHALRFALIYPILGIAELLGVAHDTLFTVVLLWVCFLTILTMNRIVGMIVTAPCKTVLLDVMTATILVFLFFLMNGRIGFAFLGYAVLLLVIVRHHYQREFSIISSIALLIGLTLCSVSSGTLTSAAFIVFLAVYFEACRSFRRGSLTRSGLALFFSCFVLGVLLTRFSLVGIYKNLSFYGGDSEGFMRMLEHGFGGALYPALHALGLPLAIFLAVTMGVLFSLLLSRMPHSLLVHLLLAAIVCGAFGYSTLSLAALPLIALMAVVFASRSKRPAPFEGTSIRG
jgi:hypothetical protein